VINSNDKKVFGVVLAAGAASRFGSTKQLAEIDGTTLVQRSHDVAIDACGSSTVLVVGHDWQAVRDACELAGGFLIVNQEYNSGLGTSIAQAVRSVQHVADAIVVLLADQVLITSEHVRALVAAWDGAHDRIVATAYADTVGAPVLFPSGCFADLAKLEGDSGGRQLLSDERFQVTEIVFEAAAVDIDTPDDLKQISHNARN
jgi:molybdenum cofactor cytidylyltransferase